MDELTLFCNTHDIIVGILLPIIWEWMSAERIKKRAAKTVVDDKWSRIEHYIHVLATILHLHNSPSIPCLC